MRFEQLLDATNYEDPFPKKVLYERSVAMMAKLYPVFHLSLNRYSAPKAVEMLLKEARFLRKSLSSQALLLAKRIDLLELLKNSQLLRRYLTAHPDLEKRVSETDRLIYQTLDIAEILKTAIEAETIMSADAVHIIADSKVDQLQSKNWDLGFEENPWITKKLFMPNATANSIHRNYQGVLLKRCWLPENAHVCTEMNFKASQLNICTIGWNNWAGKMLERTLSPGLLGINQSYFLMTKEIQNTFPRI